MRWSRTTCNAAAQELIDHNQVAKADVWSPRLVDLPASANGKPVVVGISASGTDVDLFRRSKVRGIAFDEHMNPSPALVRPKATLALAGIKPPIK